MSVTNGMHIMQQQKLSMYSSYKAGMLQNEEETWEGAYMQPMRKPEEVTSGAAA